MKSGVWRIEHREPTFRHKAAFVTESNPFEYQYELLSDGREVVGTQRGARTVSSLRWEGNALVVTWRTQRSDGSGTTVEDVDKVRAFGRGWLFIESYGLTRPQRGERAAFETITFSACLTWPDNIAP